MDKFISMKELQENTIEDKDWHIETEDNNSDITILAIHGGGIEPATSELAFVTAQTNEYNYFTFKEIDDMVIMSYMSHQFTMIMK